MSKFQLELDRINAELEYAAEKWGTDFDDKNTLNDWISYAGMYSTDAARMGNDEDKQYAMLIKAAGLLVNAAERVRTGRVAPRHYEGDNVDRQHGEGRAFLKVV